MYVWVKTGYVRFYWAEGNKTNLKEGEGPTIGDGEK